MKKIILLICTLGIFAACYDDTDIWQNITSLDQRVTELEKLCREMNTNISALSALVRAVEERDYITNVSPINNNGEEIGYTISFAKGSSITIYHGQNGADGKDGQDGVDGKTPVIGVRKDADGIYYWTLNGDWLLDDAGNKIKAIATDGVDGADGADGQNGVTPQLKIVDGKWYVSYDNGENWIEVGPAAGPQGPQGETGATGPQGPAGSNGQDGQDGDSFFQGIDTSNADYVVFTLADGTQIQIPTWSAFEALKSQCEQMNKNIEALSAIVNALQNNDYVTSVTPIYEGGKEIGYIINFSKSGSVTIYHGKDGADGSNGQDGQDGADGKDGQTPIIGVAKDTDDIYYWTVNGQWLLDENGQKVKAEGLDGADGSNGSNGTDGAPGQDGSDGKDGQDGVTPKLKIENGLWYVSYDNGATWLEVGKAVGEQGPQGEAGATGPQGPQGPAGSNGQDGHDGDSFFQGVDYQSSTDYVTFTLADGTQIKVPTWSAFEALKKQCEQMNANIEALSVIVNALQNNDYVTSVTPIYEGGKEVGYIINFSKSGSVTIYHGKDGLDGSNGQDGQDGQDGADGKDGQTPVIGVAKDTDGIYYWTVNGQWLVDENGQKVKAEGLDGADGSNGSNGTDGAPGQDGADGKDGQDGITPKLKIENGLWYVSYDNGATWLEVGKATGEQGPQGETGATGPQGPQGQPGVGGDSMFSDIDYSASTDYIVFVLSNGTQIKVPTWSAFEALKKQCEQMNANIEALSVIVNALQNNDYVTSVTPIYEGGKEIGYTINFSKSGSVTIYHGKDGADGSNGQDGAPGQSGTNGVDGHTPVIGVAKDTDGIYYWTVDGAWLLDAAGHKVPTTGKDGQNGSNGTPGQDGAPGKDGVTPKLKIENGLWYVSYDNGATWLEVGKATGDQGPQGETGATGPQGPQGPAGSNGQDGDSFFQGVDYQSSADYVTFTLADGTQIKVPTWSAFEALKKQCEQMNANIEALSVIVNALQNNDYVTSVTPIYEGGKEIGYTINFSKSGSVTIYHGKDGQDGADGKDGHTPIIGVAKDTDGIYYWTVDGAWLLGSDGQKVKAVGIEGQNGSNGQNGATGAPGADGQDGVTPQLKIENGKWYVSYNNGQSWLEIGQATGDQGPQGETGATGPQGPQGPAGSNGHDGDSFFQGVDYQSSADYVTFTLADGTQIKVPTWSAFEALKKQCEQMNANIEALSIIVNALQNNDYIKSITPIYEGVKEIGYIIEFTKSGKVTIYHGKDGAPGANGSDGADGANGIDGHTPIIGVAKDTDGIYYWTVDGAWLLGSDGQKVKAVGVDGQNGSNGSNGANGQDGITPKLKIENGLWYVSYDNGATWLEVGKATGDQGPQGETGATGPQGPQGPAGSNGQDGDSFFQGVDYQSSADYVTFTLADGTQIKVPTWSAFEALKKQCEQMNANIEALSVIVNALQNNDYVTSVTPIYEGGKEIGYIINFSKSGSVTIYHGKDGQTPVIGVAKDTDGIYYWTVNGQWLLDENGQKVKAVGVDGQNGSNGSNGANGQDGITPQLKIENGLWYVSYDNGATWLEVGKATGDQGPQGETGVDGDAFFQSVTQDEENVYMVLADGTTITIPRTPPVAATLTLDKVTGFTATFNGTVNKTSRDLKVTVYYSTTDNLTVYKHKGKVSVTEFNGDTFTLKLTELAAETTYYYFTEVICNGVVKFTEVDSFRTGKADSYVDWGEGENVGGEI